ncbi:MAG: hypothetical protein KDE28_30795, partial [Anaerolineales bacterium]|nr:hypothetical protein [Anaerolineales bacterium]
MMPQPSKHPGSRLIRHIQRRSGTAILFSGQLPAADEMPTAVPVSQSQAGNPAQRSQMPLNGLRTVTTAAPHPHSAGTGPNILAPAAIQRAALSSQTPAAPTPPPASWSSPQQTAPNNLAQRSGPVLAHNHVPGYSPT